MARKWQTEIQIQVFKFHASALVTIAQASRDNHQYLSSVKNPL